MHICFLDIDGTLLLTGGAGQSAFCHALADEFDIATRDHEVSFAGRSDRAIVRDLFDVYGIPSTEENWQRFTVSYVRCLDRLLPTHDGYVLPGAVALLDALAARGDVALGLLTGNVREAARHKLLYYGLWERFAFGGFGDDHYERNDIAAAALAAARRHLNGCPTAPGSPDGVIVVIGDTVNDIRCARSIGAQCVAVPTGQVASEQLRAEQPDALVESLENATPILQLFNSDPVG